MSLRRRTSLSAGLVLSSPFAASRAPEVPAGLRSIFQGFLDMRKLYGEFGDAAELELARLERSHPFLVAEPRGDVSDSFPRAMRREFSLPLSAPLSRQAAEFLQAYRIAPGTGVTVDEEDGVMVFRTAEGAHVMSMSREAYDEFRADKGAIDDQR